MNILVFGAGNRAGRYLIERALEQDHYVTAFIPHTEENEFPVHKNLLIVSGAISDYNAIDEAMQAVVNGELRSAEFILHAEEEFLILPKCQRLRHLRIGAISAH
ncbi:MAG: hypothetical protein H7Y03_06310, partial [Chitinophagaceae bacterium]|nr:hypothetical protein [Chitinophagaceae bacterium]